MTNKNIFVCKDNFVYHLISYDVAVVMLLDKTGTYEIDAISTEDESCVEIDSLEKLEEEKDSQLALAIGFRDNLTPSGKPLSIYDSVEALKLREQDMLRDALRKYGERTENGYEYHFKYDTPTVAADPYDDPHDVVVSSVKMNKDGFIHLAVEDKGSCDLHEISARSVFAGHLEFVGQYMAFDATDTFKQ